MQNSFIKDLDDEIGLMHHLREILLQEQEALVSADTQNLPKITEKKKPIIDQLSSLWNLRAADMTQAGLPATQDGINSWIEMCAAKAGSDSQGLVAVVKTKWMELLLITRESKDLNRVNGKLILRLQQRTAESLKSLQASNPAAEKMYGPTGQTNSKFGTRTIGVG